MKKKVIYYSDPLNEEFSGNNIKRKPLPKNYKYIHTFFLWRALSWFLYFCIGRPILWVVGKIWMGVSVKGKKNLKSVRKTGAFIYGNHTQIVDAWTVQCYVSSKRGYVLANQDSTSIKGLGWAVAMLGCLPVPENNLEREKFVKAIAYRRKQHANIAVFPEAHIWPYCTHIRPFKDDAFVYPAELGDPIVAMVTTYRKRTIFKNLSPRMDIHVSKPIYPNMSLSLNERKKELRDKCYDFMLTHAYEDENVEYIKYIRKAK